VTNLFLLGLFLLIIAIFGYVFLSRIRSKGTIALHRHRSNERRKRKEVVVIDGRMNTYTKEKSPGRVIISNGIRRRHLSRSNYIK